MARTRDYKAEYARRVAGTAPRSPERQRRRGHAPPPGTTEAAYRRRREQERVRATGGMTSKDRQDMKAWFYRLARETNKAAAARGRDTASAGEIAAGWADLLRAWGRDRTRQDFERLRFVVAQKRLEAYRIIRATGSGTAGMVDAEDDFIDSLDDEFGLQLEETLWFILWKSGKPPKAGEAMAA